MSELTQPEITERVVDITGIYVKKEAPKKLLVSEPIKKIPSAVFRTTEDYGLPRPHLITVTTFGGNEFNIDPEDVDDLITWLEDAKEYVNLNNGIK